MEEKPYMQDFDYEQIEKEWENMRKANPIPTEKEAREKIKSSVTDLRGGTEKAIGDFQREGEQAVADMKAETEQRETAFYDNTARQLTDKEKELTERLEQMRRDFVQSFGGR